MKKGLLFLAFFLVLSSVVSLAVVKEDRFDFLLSDKGVQLMRETIFDAPRSNTIDLGLPEDASQVSLWLDNQPKAFSNPLTL